MKATSKLISVVLILAICLSLFTVSAFADNTTIVAPMERSNNSGSGKVVEYNYRGEGYGQPEPGQETEQAAVEENAQSDSEDPIQAETQEGKGHGKVHGELFDLLAMVHVPEEGQGACRRGYRKAAGHIRKQPFLPSQGPRARRADHHGEGRQVPALPRRNPPHAGPDRLPDLRVLLRKSRAMPQLPQGEQGGSPGAAPDAALNTAGKRVAPEHAWTRSMHGQGAGHGLLRRNDSTLQRALA